MRWGLIRVKFAGDEAGGAVEGEVEKTPLDEDKDAALEFDDVDEVDEEPDEPGEKAGDVDTEDVGDGGGAANDGHIALVEIFEGRKSAAREASFDEFCGIAAALDGNLGDAGERIAFDVKRDGEIAKDEDFRMIRNG